MGSAGVDGGDLLCHFAGLWLGMMSQGCARFGYELLEHGLDAPIANHCADLVVDSDETGIDCGGADCPVCEQGAACTGGGDCASASCSDGILNQGESQVDCGGPNCSPCPLASGCQGPGDCPSPDCSGDLCSAPSCSDGILNQEETGIDCGGPHCPACGSCSDAIQNQGETGIDCGGAFCGACPSCSDGVQNQGETGVDCGGPSCSACGINTAPLAQMTVTPAVGSYDGAPATLFQGNAGASSDREDASAALSYSWDWDNDGLSDAAGVTSTHTYSAPGVYDARLTVQDTGGLKATTTFRVVVSSTSNIVLVTTASDENTVGASPASPGGSGLSLREAINYANVTAGRQSILVPAGFTIALGGSLPDVTDTLGMDIVGDGAIWDGSGTGQNEDCLTVVSPNCRIFGFEIQNCNRSPLRLDAGSTGSQVSRLKVHDNDQQVVLNDSNLRFGPYNELSRSAGYCLSIVGPGATVDYNYIHDCPARGIDVTGNSDGSLLLGNAITRCAPGILSAAAADNNVFAHNVIHANSNDGINAGLTSSGLVFRNNVFSNNIGYGLRAGAGVAAVNDHNDYFGNTAGNCTACPSLGAGSLTSDPRYMDSTLDDFRLQPSSANINAGIDTGNDVNGPAPGDGLFNGAAPDIGAREAP